MAEAPAPFSFQDVRLRPWPQIGDRVEHPFLPERLNGSPRRPIGQVPPGRLVPYNSDCSSTPGSAVFVYDKVHLVPSGSTTVPLIHPVVTKFFDEVGGFHKEINTSWVAPLDNL